MKPSESKITVVLLLHTPSPREVFATKTEKLPHVSSPEVDTSSRGLVTGTVDSDSIHETSSRFGCLLRGLSEGGFSLVEYRTSVK